MKKVKSADFGVFFDFDGTLFDTVDFHLTTFLKALELLGHDVPPGVREKFRTLVGLCFNEILRRLFPSLSEVEREKIAQTKWELSEEYVSLVHPLPWAIWTIRELEGMGIPLAIVSSSTRTFVEALVNYWQLPVNVIVTAEDVRKGKPDPEPFTTAKKRLGVNEGLAVGDTKYDALSARGAGLKFLHAYLIRRVPEVCSTLLGTRR